MDNVTHALAGLLLAEATVALVDRRPGAAPSPGFRRAAAIVGVVAAELPDADLLYAGPLLGMGKLGYLLHHRGHTHTVLFALTAALVVWGATLALRRGARRPPERRALLALTVAGTLSHLALDYTNDYGIHPFWPAVNSWYYGDAVFIVEPWLWIAALPPLLLAFRRPIIRVPLAVALVGILAIAWSTSQVGRGVALALTIGTVAWIAIVRSFPPTRRIACALAAWAGVEVLFFGASHSARDEVRSAINAATLRDVVLTPTAGDPSCFRALVVELDGATYRVTAATVAPFPALRGVQGCSGVRADARDDMRSSARPTTRRVRWGGEWSAPRAELVALAHANCEIADALRFVRVPIWRWTGGDTIRLSDLRYDGIGDGFADLAIPVHPRACPRFVPGWEPPRRDLLGAG